MERRPLTSEDAKAVFDLIAAAEESDDGEVHVELADIIADWQTPGFDLASSTLGVFDAQGLIAFAEHTGGDTGYLDVHPRGRLSDGPDPLLAELAQWVAILAHGRGAPELGLVTPQGGYNDRQLGALGWEIRRTSWVLRLPPGASIAPRPLPPGYAIGQARHEEIPALQRVIEDAFLEWAVRDRRTLEQFEAHTTRRPGFEPWLLRVVRDPGGEVVAGAVCVRNGDEAYVDQLATRRDSRGLGLAQALLVDAFAEGRARGCTRFALSTDSRTGALDLYLGVGMEVVSTWVNRAVRAPER